MPAPLLARTVPLSAEIPGPRMGLWRALKHSRQMRRDYLGTRDELHLRFGDISKMGLIVETVVDVFNPELARELLVDHAAQITRWERGPAVFAQLMGQSVLVTEGQTWQRQRRMLQPAFTPKRVAGYARLMTDAARSALDEVLPKGQARASVNIDELWTTVAMDVIMRTLFSSRAPDDARAAGHAVQILGAAAMQEMMRPFALPSWLPLPGKRSKVQALEMMRELVGRHIDERRRAPADDPRQDLLAMLLALRDEHSGEPLSPVEVFDQCMVTFQAGHETTASALLWWSRLMAEHPGLAQRAQDEVDSVLQGREPEAEDMARLPWLTATLKEAMRLYPPVGALMLRRATEDFSLGGHHIEKGWVLRVTPWVLQRDARNFPDPLRFMPQRFLPEAPPVPRGAWMPFGAGPRVCIGQHFAMLEMTLLAAMLLQRFNLSLPADARACVPKLNVTLRPEGAVPVMLTRRVNQARNQAQALRLREALAALETAS
ncbi:cytochrome P450 [Ideonella sp.]|jgi:cytochrome P450|uniref:cytochrome P450 n=1 Tax=Ideonella sp. TaxID=1929293 RepID=UPI0037C04166